MTEVNHSESKVMSAKKVRILPVITDQQSPEFVDPGEGALAGEASLVNVGIKEAFTPAFGGLTVAFILGDVGNNAVIEADFASIAGIEGTVGVEERPVNQQPQTFDRFEGRLKLGFQTKSVMMVTRHDARRSDHIPLGIGDGQNIAGFGPLPLLVSHALAAFLGDGVTAIQVQLG